MKRLFSFFQIKKHAVNCNLKVCIYGGVKKDYVLPDTLAAFDIVIVSFETLRLELCYASEVVRIFSFDNLTKKFFSLDAKNNNYCFRWIKTLARYAIANVIFLSRHH